MHVRYRTVDVGGALHLFVKHHPFARPLGMVQLIYCMPVVAIVGIACKLQKGISFFRGTVHGPRPSAVRNTPKNGAF